MRCSQEDYGYWAPVIARCDAANLRVRTLIKKKGRREVAGALRLLVFMVPDGMTPEETAGSLEALFNKDEEQ